MSWPMLGSSVRSCVVLMCVCSGTAVAQEAPATQPATQPSGDATRDGAAPTPRKRFKAVIAGTANVKDVGGTRDRTQFPWCDILVPLRAEAVTASEAPRLYWWVDKALPYSYVFSIVNMKTDDTLIKKTLPPITNPGWQEIDLAELGVKLEEGTPYLWNFSVSIPEADRATATQTVRPISTTIRRVKLDEAARKQLAAGPEDRVDAMAAQGLWIDVAAEIVKRVQAMPSDASAKADLDNLLEAFGADALRRELANVQK